MQDDHGGAGGLSGIALDQLPLLDMRVGLYGSPRHAEVGGQVCFGMVITLAIHESKGR